MAINRRRFLIGSLSAALFGLSRRLGAAALMPGLSGQPGLDGGQLRCLSAWADTLLPADEFSPAASALGVDTAIARAARDDRRYLRVVADGCRWLDRQAVAQGAAAFEHLDGSGRERIAAMAEQAEARADPRVFFERTRRDAFHHYYARPETWAMLHYPGPPQPFGFMDQARPPAAASSPP